MRGRKSIFDLERRSDLVTDYLGLMEDMKRTTIHSNDMKDCSLYAFLNKSIQDWTYRQAASSIDMYLNSLNIHKPGEEIVDTIYALELIFNLLKWAPEYDILHTNPFSGFNWDCDVSSACKRFSENIEFILEQNNMAVREFSKTPQIQYRIYKRSAEVDAALESAPNLAEILLSYLDIRNEKDEKSKKDALKNISYYLEPLRRGFKGTAYNSLCDNVFFVFNNCSIRHNNDKQIKMKKSDRMKMYDNTFKMCLILIQVQDIKKYTDEVKILKVSSKSTSENQGSNQAD